MTRTIQLTQGKVALVDASDFERLNQYKWHAARRKRTFYAASRRGGGEYRLMHREILGLSGTRLQGEHRNGNGLDNRRANLRRATNAQNSSAFHTLREGKTSSFRGVSWNKALSKWIVVIGVSGKTRYLGVFTNEVDAARAYDDAALKYFGEFAALNFTDRPYLSDPAVQT